MALRIACRRAPKALSLPGLATNSRRLYSSSSSANFFSVELSSEVKELSSVLDAVKSKARLENPARHDAAVILATPQYARCLENESFLQGFVSFLAASEKLDKFHLVSAVVDHIAPPVPRNRPIQGLSILRGPLDEILPDLWLPGLPRAREDLDKVSALSFELGNPRLTVPLANTTFQNHRTSTLLLSRFDMRQGTPSLEERIEKHLQRIALPLQHKANSVKDLGIWAPLVPITRPRVVTESFGNIVRRVSLDGDSVPASIELEPAVDELFKRRSNLAQIPMGVWAMITPPSFTPNGSHHSRFSDPDPDATFDETHDSEALVASTSSCLRELYGQGGRLYQILSGGGGWGAKKGLLSLDPQRTHFALSEEEEMQRFIQAMDGGNFVPVGSKIQFFTSPEAPPDSSAVHSPSGIVFGTSGTSEFAPEGEAQAVVLTNHFGALSNEGVFVTSSDHGHMDTTPGYNHDWKLNVPHSRIFLGMS